MTDEPTTGQGHERGEHLPDVPTAVNRLLAQAADLLSASHAPTEEQDEAERVAANLIARTERILTSGRIAPEEQGREGWTPGERAHFDARAEEEAWGLAWNILKPWVESARYIGSPELTEIMEMAFAELEKRSNAALDAVDRAEADLEKEAGA